SASLGWQSSRVRAISRLHDARTALGFPAEPCGGSNASGSTGPSVPSCSAASRAALKMERLIRVRSRYADSGSATSDLTFAIRLRQSAFECIGHLFQSL